MMGIDPHIPLAVAQVESNFDNSKVGSVGEIGIFQVRPEYVKEFNREELRNPYINIMVGIQKIKEVRSACRNIGSDIDYLVCYNVGVTGGKRIKHPKKFPYMKRVYSFYKVKD